jgi:hypothetical protein
MVVVTDLVMVTHPGVGWDSRAGKHGNCNKSEQYVPKDSHDLCTFAIPVRVPAAAGRWMEHDTRLL